MKHYNKEYTHEKLYILSIRRINIICYIYMTLNWRIIILIILDLGLKHKGININKEKLKHLKLLDIGIFTKFRDRSELSY